MNLRGLLVDGTASAAVAAAITLSQHHVRSFSSTAPLPLSLSRRYTYIYIYIRTAYNACEARVHCSRTYIQIMHRCIHTRAHINNTYRNSVVPCCCCCCYNSRLIARPLIYKSRCLDSATGFQNSHTHSVFNIREY